MMDKGVPICALASLMARIPEPLSSRAFPMGRATSRLPLAVALVVLFVAQPAAQAAEPDPWFGRDKVMHFSVSFALAGNAYADSSAFTKRTSIRVLSGVGVALSAGIAKELADRYDGGDASWRDLTWDAIGTATGTLVAWLVDRYLL
jgi:putative lipoprotein